MDKNSSHLHLENIVDAIFEIIGKHIPLTVEKLTAFKKTFYFYLVENNLQPFIEEKDIFLQEVEDIISSWSKDKIKYSFLEEELKPLFKPYPDKPWLKFLIKYQLLFVLFSSSVSIFISFIALMFQIFKSQ